MSAASPAFSQFIGHSGQRPECPILAELDCPLTGKMKPSRVGRPTGKNLRRRVSGNGKGFSARKWINGLRGRVSTSYRISRVR